MSGPGASEPGGPGGDPLGGNTDAAELAKFEAMADRWWDAEGSAKALHDINPVRLAWIEAQAGGLAGRRVLDVGCGGGLLTEALAAAGAETTGIDAGEGPLTVARLHALETGCHVRYEQATAEAWAERSGETGRWDVVTCMEMLEHVPEPGSVLAACARLLVPGGTLVLATINRSPLAYATAVLGAEYVLGLLPRGTHDYRRFIRPAELAARVRDAGLVVTAIEGLAYDPFRRRARTTPVPRVNYMLAARRPRERSA